MKLMVRVFLLAPLFFAATQAAACSCAFEIEEFDYSVRRFPLVFTGKVIQVDRVNNSTGRFVSATYRFVVTRSWQGGLADTITLKTEASNCHVLLHRNRKYVIYAYSTDHISICNRIVERRSKIKAESRKLDAYFTEPPLQPKPSTN